MWRVAIIWAYFGKQPEGRDSVSTHQSLGASDDRVSFLAELGKSNYAKCRHRITKPLEWRESEVALGYGQLGCAQESEPIGSMLNVSFNRLFRTLLVASGSLDRHHRMKKWSTLRCPVVIDFSRTARDRWEREAEPQVEAEGEMISLPQDWWQPVNWYIFIIDWLVICEDNPYLFSMHVIVMYIWFFGAQFLSLWFVRIYFVVLTVLSSYAVKSWH